MSKTVNGLRARGQSIWLDFIRRAFLENGGLDRYISEGWITGLTSNPTIFAKAIAGSSDYDQALKDAAGAGMTDPYNIFVQLAGDDIRRAADAFRPIYDRTNAADGYVSFETPPGIEDDTTRTVDEARRLFSLVDRPNVMIKVPGTPSGISALETLIADGINVNVTLLFDVKTYEEVAEAYLAGLERRHENGDDLSHVASVASFFISRIDTAVNRLLPEDSALRGRIAIANAGVAYGRFQEFFSGPRWERLARNGGQVQRPLWASTGTKDPSYSDVLYVESLIARNTVNTMPDATLRAFLAHGQAGGATPVEDSAAAEAALRELEGLGVNLGEVTSRLLQEGLASFSSDFESLLGCIRSSISAARVDAMAPGSSLGSLSDAVEMRLSNFAETDTNHRIWSYDHTLWADDPTEIADRLGWLALPESMSDQVADLQRLAHEVSASGYELVVLLGMGGSSLAPEVIHATLGGDSSSPGLATLDTTDPASIRAVEEKTSLDRMLFIAASKSGTTVETLSQLAYFWDKIPDGSHFVVITDPGTPLEKVGRERGFRRVFLNQPDIGGRYSALSHFGLVPAALIGADVELLLGRAHEMQQACHPCVAAAENPGAWLGAVIGEAALAGRDKLTLFVPDELYALGAWVEQLIAESTGKRGRGILPVEGEPLGDPDVYGDDRLFVSIGDRDGLDDLEAAGHPVVRLPYVDKYQIGAEFFRWEYATAVAGHVLGIHPFDQPNVQEAKDATNRILAGATFDESTGPVAGLLDGVDQGDYIAMLAYVPRNPENTAVLQAARMRLRDRHRVATTVGFGPRFLHSTGQLHKGGPGTGVFIQIVGDDPSDISIPGQEYTFGQLKHAQALGDLESLRAHERRVARATMAQIEEMGR